jgi:cytosine/adenosine deaminase-related metal-dependent hydrolase
MSDDRLKPTLKDVLKDKAFKGATVNLGELRRQDGLIAESLDKGQRNNLGVVQTFITAVDDDNYRQILKLARWRSPRHTELYVKAINICRVTGAPNALRTILDMITAQSAGENAALMHEAAEALTHTTVTSREEIERKKRNDQRAKSNSPLG